MDENRLNQIKEHIEHEKEVFKACGTKLCKENEHKYSPTGLCLLYLSELYDYVNELQRIEDYNNIFK